ncbi:hypothetical protein Hanom_Chr15g01343491 [Helianthus anomalus]
MMPGLVGRGGQTVNQAGKMRRLTQISERPHQPVSYQPIPVSPQCRQLTGQTINLCTRLYQRILHFF